ncbi:MAG TPA: hypothetical protein VGI43_14775 [Mucilaginibacter sp.]|jgi:type 1 fimbria pilin
MKKILLSSAILLFVGASFGFRDDTVHLKGVIEDSTCANSKQQMTPGDSRVACVKKCIKEGAKAVLVVDDKIYQIANQKKVMPYAGKEVVVDGTLTNDSIDVSKIADAK